MTNTSFLDKRYRDGNGYMVVIGIIDRPAIILKNPLTGEEKTVVIGCPNHLAMEEITNQNALAILEADALLNKSN